MRVETKRCLSGEQGFTITEVLMALLITGIVMAAVFALLYKGQDSFDREPEVADLQQNARAGLDRISRDLTLAGYETPAAMAVIWNDGGGGNPPMPDQITIIYADPNYPTCEPMCMGGGGGCGTLENSSTAWIEPTSFHPQMDDPTQAYADDMVLLAIETDDCNGDGLVGVTPFELTKDPEWAGSNVKLTHNPGQSQTEINLPGGFNGSVQEDCAIIGLFRMIEYRINPPPPAEHPVLERRDLSMIVDGLGSPQWMPVSTNIENLQFQYAVGTSDIFQDYPAMSPVWDDPDTWVTRVKVTVFGRTESRNLQGSSAGVFASEDTHLRKSFSTTVTLRNQIYNASELDEYAWN
jgi:prepilin-type N-terminal cleavage/methylation domain-containing protein